MTTEKPKAIIVDLDGTIADAKHRLHLVEGETPDWDKFFDAMVLDSFMRDNYNKILFFLDEISEDLPVLFITGRRDTHMKQTNDWLKKNGVYDDLHIEGVYMREGGDHRPDTEVKQEIYETVIEPFFDVVMAFDDRPRVLRMWKEMGIPTTDLGDGVEF